MYSFLLAFAGALLYSLPVSRGTSRLQSNVANYVVAYWQLLALDVVLVVLFTNRPKLNQNKNLPLILRRKMSQAQQRRLVCGAWI